MNRISLILFAASAFAANEMDSPSLGCVWDAPSKSMRRLIGLPGSVRNEAGPVLPAETLAAWASPDGSQIVFALPGERVQRLNLKSGELEEIAVTQPDEVLFSADGRNAALWWKAEKRFAKWGETSRDLNAKSIQVLNDGDAIFLDFDGLLQTAKGVWLGNFGSDATFAVAGSRLVVAAPGVFIAFEQNEKDWQQRARNEYEGIPVFKQIEIESPDSVLAVGGEGQLTRWQIATGSSETLSKSGVERLRAYRQPGVYLAEGEIPMLLFALNSSQKLYIVPAPEVHQ